MYIACVAKRVDSMCVLHDDPREENEGNPAWPVNPVQTTLYDWNTNAESLRSILYVKCTG
jgi:hypothetical protein